MALKGTHDFARESIISGFLGASAVALWFLLLDSIQGRPFHTPAVLGEALFSLLRYENVSPAVLVAGYTLFHFGVFMLVGVLLVYLVHKSRRYHSILAGVLLSFVVFEVGFYFLAALLSTPTILGDIAWYQIAIGNLLAAASMSVYLVRTHPMLGSDFAYALRGEDPN